MTSDIPWLEVKRFSDLTNPICNSLGSSRSALDPNYFSILAALNNCNNRLGEKLIKHYKEQQRSGNRQGHFQLIKKVFDLIISEASNQNHPYTKWLKKSHPYNKAISKFNKKSISSKHLLKFKEGGITLSEADLKEILFHSMISRSLLYYHIISTEQINVLPTHKKLEKISHIATKLLSEIDESPYIKHNLSRDRRILERLSEGYISYLDKKVEQKPASISNPLYFKKNHKKIGRESFVTSLHNYYFNYFQFESQKSSSNIVHADVIFNLTELIDPETEERKVYDILARHRKKYEEIGPPYFINTYPIDRIIDDYDKVMESKLK